MVPDGAPMAAVAGAPRLAARATRLAVVVTGWPGEEAGMAELLAQACRTVRALGAEPAAATAVVDRAAIQAAGLPADLDATLIVQYSWTPDTVLQPLFDAQRTPLLLWGLPTLFPTGSLMGAQHLAFLCRSAGCSHALVVGSLESPRARARAADFLAAAGTRHRLRNAVIGLIGNRMPGIADLAVDELGLRRTFGVALDVVPSATLWDRVSQIDEAETAAALRTLAAATGRRVLPRADLVYGARVYVALRQVVQERGWVAVGTECLPVHGGHPCLANALLTDEGVPAAPEGDALGALQMLLSQWLAGVPAMDGEIWEYDEAENLLLLSHGGCTAFSMAPNAAAITVDRYRNRPGTARPIFQVRGGRVTLFMLAGQGDHFRLGLAGGEAGDAPRPFRAADPGAEFPGSPAFVRPDVAADRLIEEAAAHGFGHHWMLAHGDLRPRLRLLCGMLGVDCVELTP